MNAIGSVAESKNFYIAALKQYFEPEKPLVKMFPTASGYYLYDTGNNKILHFKEEAGELIRDLLTEGVAPAITGFVSRHGEGAFIDAAKTIETAIEKENVMRVTRVPGFAQSDHFLELDELLKNSVQSVNLEVTQECNLRCRYCVYNDFVNEKRDHERQVMSFDTARRAIDFLNEHSAESDEVTIGFYGGEPLLRFPFIKECVAYAHEVFGSKKLLFTVTTNAVRISDEIARFLLDEEFSVLVSLDGPREIHDRYRKDKAGNGCFDAAFKGLKTLAEAYREIQKGMVSVNMVYAPPFSEAKLNVMADFIEELKWLPGIHVSTSFPTEGTISPDMVPETGLVQDKDMLQWAFEKYGAGFAQSNPMVKGIIERLFTRLMQRPIYKDPMRTYPLNGCCVPGRRKNFITADGSILVCERMPHNAPAIGHVDTGFHMETIKRVYVKGYAESSLKDCAGCWAARFCDICYQFAYNADGEMDMAKKRKYCGYNLENQERILRNFIHLLETAPGQLEYLYQHDIK